MNPLAIVALLLSFALVAAGVSSASIVAPSYPSYESGTSQYYSVIYDNEEEAGVAAYITVQNTGKEAIEQLTLEIPGTGVRLINAIQEVRKPSRYCRNWEDVCTNLSETVCQAYIRTCASWATDYYSSSPQYYTLDRQVEQLSFSAKYAVTLEVPVPEGESTSLILYYKASGLASGSFGVTIFKFETVKMAYDTSRVRVAVNTQPDVYLKGAPSRVKNLPNLEVASSFAGKAAASPELSSFSRSITYQPGYVKQSYSLDPWESFVVNGSYSESWLALYWQKVLLWILGIGGAIAAVAAIIVFAAKKAGKSPVAKMLLLGAASGIATVIMLALLSLLLVSAGNSYSYRALAPLVLLLMLAVFISGMLMPGIYAASKHGFGLGAAAFAVSFLVIATAIILLFFVLLFLLQPVYYARILGASVIS